MTSSEHLHLTAPGNSHERSFSGRTALSGVVSCLMILGLTACATTPSGPPSVAQTATGQSLDKSGNFEIEHLGQYALLVGKIDTPTGTVAALTPAGEPVAVSFVNLSSAPLSFGPDNISIKTDDGSSPDLLTSDQITNLESGKKIGDRIGETFSILGMLAGAASVGMAEGNGQISSLQANEDVNVLGNAGADAVQNADADVENIDSQNAALQAASNGVILATQSVAPQHYNAGVVVIKDLNPTSSFTITIKENGNSDQFHYNPPPSKPAAARTV